MAAAEAVAAPWAVAAGATTTTSRSERRARSLARRLSVLVLAVSAATGCSRHREAPPAPSSNAPAPVPAPSGLLARGAIRKPADLWRRGQELLDGRARLMPSSFALALSTVVLESPLAAGLIDGEAPVALAAVMDTDGRPGFVAGVRLTSGGELLALLTTGADAKFDGDRRADGLTVLRARAPAGPLALGVAASHLLLASSDELLAAGGLFVARTVAPAIGEGEPIELVASHEALAGALASTASANLGALRARFQSADAEARRAHGGRNPDFGDPAPLVGALGGLSEEGVALLRSATEARLTLSLEESGVRLRAELLPEATGALRELTAGMETGSLAPLLSLPAWVDAALFTPLASPEEPPFAGRLEAVLGDRLKGPDKERLRAFLVAASRGLGRARAAGVFDGGGVGFFAVGNGGDATALGRAVDSLPSVAKIPAVQGPLDALAGRPTFTRPPGSTAGPTRWVVRFAKRTADTAEPFGVAASSAGDRSALVVAPGDAAGRLADLLSAAGTPTVGADPAVAHAVARAGDSADGCLLVRIRGEADARRFALLAFGSDRKVTWAEVVMSEAAFGTLVRASVAP